MRIIETEVRIIEIEVSHVMNQTQKQHYVIIFSIISRLMVMKV